MGIEQIQRKSVEEAFENEFERGRSTHSPSLLELPITTTKPTHTSSTVMSATFEAS